MYLGLGTQFIFSWLTTAIIANTTAADTAIATLVVIMLLL